MKGYELAITSRSVNCYHLFIKCSTREYRKMSPQRKIELIVDVFGEIQDHYDETDFRAIDIARRKWNTLPRCTKEAWKVRARFLNKRPKTGQFDVIPYPICLELPSYYRNAMSTDMNKLKRSIQRMMLGRLDQKNYFKKIYMPHEIIMKTQIFRQFTVSTLVLDLLFGRNLEKFRENESVTLTRNRQAFKTFHLMSRDRLIDVFSVTDVNLSYTYYPEDGHKLYLCPSGTLVDRNNISHRAYALESTDDEIVFYYPTDGSGRMSTTKTKIPRWIDGNEYDLSNCVNEDFYLLEFNPVCISICRENITNLKICSARICLDERACLVKTKSS